MRSVIASSLSVVIAVSLVACSTQKTTPPPSKDEGGVSAIASASATPSLYRKTTSGSIEVGNLHGKIDALEGLLKQKPGDLALSGSLAESVLLRASFLGTYEDFDRAFALANAAVETHPGNPAAWLLRAQARAHVHQFDDALADLKKAESQKGDAGVIARRRVSIDIARAQSLDAALAARRKAFETAPGYNTAADLAAVQMARGEYDDAETSFLKSLEIYRDVSPFIVSWVFFQRGVMWAEHAGKPEKSRRLYEEAVARLPRYVQANVHLAEMEAEAGAKDAAIARLRTLLDVNEPEAVGLLGELVGGDEGAALIERARARYEELLAKYPLAFADHATEFYLGPGKNPSRALELAKMNHANRKTVRATELLSEARTAASQASSPPTRP